MGNLIERMKLLSEATEASAIRDIIDGTHDLAKWDEELKSKLVNNAILFFESVKYGLLLVQMKHKNTKKPNMGMIEILDKSRIALHYFGIIDQELYDPYLKVLTNIRDGVSHNMNDIFYRNILLDFYNHIHDQAMTKCRNLAHFAEDGCPGDFDFL